MNNDNISGRLYCTVLVSLTGPDDDRIVTADGRYRSSSAEYRTDKLPIRSCHVGIVLCICFPLPGRLDHDKTPSME